MKKNTVQKNFIYNILLTGINVLFPLIVSPYISEILGATNIGKVNYANAFINWFVLIATFGIPIYGIREIAKNKNNKEKLTSIFYNLVFLKVVLTIFCLCIYVGIIYILPSYRSDISLYLVMILTLLLNIVSIDWFYQGLEDYSFIAIRSIIVKIISLVLIFLCIKNGNDYILYAVINILGLGFNNILSYINAKKYINNKIPKIQIFEYMNKLKVFFISTLVIALYTQLDQIMIGNLAEKADLAFYVRSKTVLAIALSITTSLNTVLIPKASYLFSENYEMYKKLLQKALNSLIILSLPLTAGIFLLSNEVMLFLGGQEFLPAAKSLRILSLVIIIVPIGYLIFNQIFIPQGNEKIGMKLQVISAIISIVFNIILIPKFSYIGAAITWVSTEIIITVVAFNIIRKKYNNIKLNFINESVIKAFFAMLLMISVILVLKSLIDSILLSIIICGVIGILIYGLSLILMREIEVLEILTKIRVKLNI